MAEQLQDAGASEAMDPRLSELLEWTRLHALERHMSVDRVAMHMGYNRNYLSRMFKQRFGTGLRDYIHRIRLEAARELLVSSKLHIKEIADRVGIEDRYSDGVPSGVFGNASEQDVGIDDIGPLDAGK
ncbi:AraC family transcriptional regulator [Paenibacillus sp. AR247]|uniref:helix-turn-helix domain-containing protein n=1 Tax=Paenibacillus sp. AR247 TaxID=1631599 RepID=UPI000CF9A472|nr:helix-turn-helix transcriptional regulator [Paenibacillus sp. AR247]PQP89137.1 hypothetical protein CPT76_13240 [Paenibacillus sp. AR247]